MPVFPPQTATPTKSTAKITRLPGFDNVTNWPNGSALKHVQPILVTKLDEYEYVEQMSYVPGYEDEDHLRSRRS